MSDKQAEKEAHYLYCVTDSSAEISLGEIGLGGNLVYTIPAAKLSAVVHDCPPEPYDSDDSEEVKGWVRSHQNVLDRVLEKTRFSGVIPASFDTILQPGEDRTATENVRYWLKSEAEALEEQLEKVKNKEEYGVRVAYDPDWLQDTIQADSEEFKSLKKKIDETSEGAAYLYREKLKKMREDRIEEVKERYISEFYDMIAPTVPEIKREEKRELPGKNRLLLNLSCLVPRGEYEELGEVLERIDEREGFDVKFTGPWAPFSFTEVNGPESEA